MTDATDLPLQPNPPQRMAMTIIPFNLNSYIYVQLTPAGHAWHEAKHASLVATMPELARRRHTYQRPHENADGWSRWSAWQFMNLFGDQMYQGNPDPVSSMNIMLDFVPPKG